MRPRENSTVAVDLSSFNMRGVFEGIGEDATLWYQHVQTLANPFFEGRVNESDGTERARNYIQFYFELYGLDPAFPADGSSSLAAWSSYRQPFDFRTRGRLTLEVDDVHAAIDGRALIDGEDFTFLGVSGSGDVDAPVTFVGYGIEDGSDGYSSFDEDTDLTGRIALLLRYEPLDEEGESQWREEGRTFSSFSRLDRKFRAVKERGAAGIILVNPPDCSEGRSGLESLRGGARFGRPLGIPALQFTPDAAESLLRSVDPEGRSLLQWRRLADEGRVTTVDLDDSTLASIGGQIERSRSGRTIPAENVGAVLRGKGDLADKWLVIGAHYDHHGYGMNGATPASGELMPGADDNASGTAGLLVLAKTLSEAYEHADDDENLRSVLFIAFDAEERGLHGSRHYCDNTTIEPEEMVAMLNMDMIGRLRSGEIYVLGTGTGEGLPELLDPLFEDSGLTISQTPGGSGRADDANFRRIGVPAMHFFTGIHDEYTTPQDKAHTVNPIGAVKVLDLLYDVAMGLVSTPNDVRYTVPEEAETSGVNHAYAPVRLGVQPGMGADLDTGIAVEAVSKGTSADLGGIKAGDVMLMWDDTVLDSMRTFATVLRQHKPGDVVTITVERDGEEIELDVMLKPSTGERRRPGQGHGGG